MPEQLARRRRVLVVEDDPSLRDIVADALRIEGYEVREAADGSMGLTLLREWRPDAIILDLMLPGVSGFGFRTGQLADPATAAVPVIVFSAQRNVEAWAESLQADAIIPKPFELDELLATVRRLVGA
jgi:two-component system OmpR family response regulator